MRDTSCALEDGSPKSVCLRMYTVCTREYTTVQQAVCVSVCVCVCVCVLV